MTPGIYQIDATTYHADALGCDTQPMLSASIASILLRQSPMHAHAAHPRLGGFPPDESETFDLGTAAHAMILEGTTDRYAIIEANDWRTNAAKAARDEARANGKTPILAKHADRMRLMANMVLKQVQAHTDEPVPLEFGKPEQTLVWNDGGVWCKARVDWLHDDLQTIDDLKTGAVSAKPDAWTRTIYGRGGDLQAAFYLRGLKAITGEDAAFRWIVAENTYPFATSVIALSPEGLAEANERVEQAIRLWGQCLANDAWPGYPTRTCYIDPPAWALMQHLEAAEQEAV